MRGPQCRERVAAFRGAATLRSFPAFSPPHADFARRPVPAVAGLLLCLVVPSPAAFARDNRVEALNQRMATAEAQYRQALDDADAGDDGARASRRGAGWQMKTVVSDCGRTRGCDLQAILAT